MPWNREANKELNQALSKGDLARFRKLLDQFPANLPSSKGYCRWLTHAAEAGLFDFVTFLVEEMGIDPGELDSARDWSTVTPAVYALGRDYREIAVWLLKRGAEINTEFEGVADCQILKKAAAMGDLELVKWLVEHGADVNAPGLEMQNAYMRADDEVIREFLRSVGSVDLEEVAVLDLPASHQKLLELFDQFGEEDGLWGHVLNWKKEYSGEPNIALHCLEPAVDKESQLLFTVGVCDIALNEDEAEPERLEFIHVLSPEWPLDSTTADNPYWDSPMIMLNNLARLILNRGTWTFYDRPPDWSRPVWSIEMNDDSTQPIAPGTGYGGCLIRAMESWTMPNYREMTVYEVLPIYAEEADFLRDKRDYQPLILRFRALGIEREFTLNRPNAVTDWSAGEPEPEVEADDCS